MDTLQVAQHLQTMHEVLLITGGGEKDEFEAAYLTAHLPQVRQERINGFSGSLQPIHDFKAYLKIRKTLRRFKPHIVHTHTAKAGLLGRLAAAAEKVPVIVHTYHGLMFSGYYNAWVSRWVVRVERWLAKKSTRIIALSNTQRHQIANQYAVCAAEKIEVVPLGINLDAFMQADALKRQQFRTKYYLNDSQIAVGIVGRVVPVKNHAFFIKVVAALHHLFPQLRFFVVGDGPLRRKLQQEAKNLGIEQTFFPEEPKPATLCFTSWITEVDVALAGLDIVVLTSLNEGTPVSLMEAQAAAKPVMATRAGGIEDIVVDGHTGFTVEQGNLQDFCDKLSALVHNPGLRSQMGQNGVLFAKKQFQKERQVEDLNLLYHQLLFGKPK